MVGQVDPAFDGRFMLFWNELRRATFPICIPGDVPRLAHHLVARNEDRNGRPRLAGPHESSQAPFPDDGDVLDDRVREPVMIERPLRPLGPGRNVERDEFALERHGPW